MRFFVLTNVVLPIFVVFFCSTSVVVSAVVANENVCNLTEQGSEFDFQELSDCDFVALDPLFFPLLEGTNYNSGITVLLENDLRIFHEGPVLLDDALFFTSDRLGINTSSPGPTWGSTAPAQPDQFIQIYRLDLATNELSVVTPSPDIVMANGMTKTADGKNIFVLSQGFNDTGGAIYLLDPTTFQATPIVSTFYGAKFNSLNDIKVTVDGIIFFSDPVYGFEQGFRTGNPQLGSNVYRYDTNTQALTVLITDLQRPNGIALSDDRSNGNGCTLFVTDSGFGSAAQSPRGFDGFGDSALYTMKDDSGSGSCFEPVDGPFVLQPLAPVVSGIQDGIHVHESAQLLLYCDGDGLWVWSIPLYRPLGVVRMPCTQLQFQQGDEADEGTGTGISTVYILAETRLYTIEFNFSASIASATAARNTTASSSAAAATVVHGFRLVSIMTLIATVWSSGWSR
jgi:sugar lactone lactonase YvrE